MCQISLSFFGKIFRTILDQSSSYTHSFVENILANKTPKLIYDFLIKGVKHLPFIET
jgi:hypothetical protein